MKSIRNSAIIGELHGYMSCATHVTAEIISTYRDANCLLSFRYSTHVICPLLRVKSCTPHFSFLVSFFPSLPLLGHIVSKFVLCDAVFRVGTGVHYMQKETCHWHRINQL
jgi:hypothetical protein